jgi:hypothetical protein
MDTSPPVNTTAASAVPPPTPVNPVPAQAASTPAASKLPGFIALLNETWQFFKSRFKLFVLMGLFITGMPYAVGFIGGLLGGVLEVDAGLNESSVASMVIVLVSTALAAFAGVWGWSALVVAIVHAEEGIGFVDAFKRALRMLHSIVWVSILGTLLLFAGFALLIVPFVLFAIWFTFSTIVLVAEKKRGLTALLTSKEYVRGLFGPILGRYVLLGLLIAGMYLALLLLSLLIAGLFILISPAIAAVVVGLQVLLYFVLPIFLMPLGIVYTYIVFKHVKAIKGGVTAVVTTGQRALYGVLTVFGLVAIPILFLTLASAVFLSYMNTSTQSNSQNVEQFALFPYQMALEFHFAEYQTYPTTLEELLANDPSADDEDRMALNELIYEAGNDGMTYTLCSVPEVGAEPVCVTGGSKENAEDDILTE